MCNWNVEILNKFLYQFQTKFIFDILWFQITENLFYAYKCDPLILSNAQIILIVGKITKEYF